MTAIFAFCVSFICVFEYCIVKLADGTSVQGDVNYFDIAGIFGHIGVAMFVFEGNSAIVTLRDEAKDKKAFPKILVAGLFTDLILFMAFGLICYFTFLQESDPIIILNLVPINVYTSIIRVLICYNCLCSYPIQILVAFNIIEGFSWFSKGSKKV